MASKSEADSLILDLTSVRSREKYLGREMVRSIAFRQYKYRPLSGGLLVRIHAPGSADFAEDCELFSQSLNGIVFSASSSEDVLCLDSMTARGMPDLFPLIECEAGALNAEMIAGTSRRVKALLCAESCSRWQSQVVHACRVAGIPAIDGPFPGHRDETRIFEAAQAARDHGFAGTQTRHPLAAGAINKIFSPASKSLSNAE
jgi:citrate lyase subunit beta/citryl-CoA lyase